MPHLRAYRSSLLNLALIAMGALICPALPAAEKDKDTPKKAVVETWVELRTPGFVVASDGGEKTARRFADQFAQARRIFLATMPHARVTFGVPIYVLAARDAKSFAQLLPEFPVDKRRSQPGGIFIPGPEKTYIVVRANASGPLEFEEIYKQYAHQVLRLSYHSLPPWLEEGYADVFGNMRLTEKGARLGRPEPEDLSVLWESPLLPLDLVFHVDRNSAYYTNSDKTGVFFAESRALMHYLLADSQATGSQPLERYIAQVESGADPLESARQIFGDLNQLQAKLEAYIKQPAGVATEITSAAGSDAISGQHTLSAAEAQVRLGDLALARGQLDRAQTNLEEAIKLDGNLAGAQESMGFLLLRQTQLAEAQKYFARAAELDPKNALAYYGSGLAIAASDPLAAAAFFEKSVQIDAEFAPAWSSLAALYADRPDTLQKALAAAQHAATLSPGDTGYQFQLAAILERTGHKDEGRKVTAQLSNAPQDGRDPNGTRETSPGGPQVQSSPSPSAPASATIAQNPPAERTLRIERKTEPDDKPAPARSAGATSAAPAETAASPPPLEAPGRSYSMVGTISEVNCSEAPQIKITLKAQTLLMHLHAANFSQLAVKGSGIAAIGNAACSSLRGKTARVTYQLATDKPWDGEIQSVEMR